MKYKMFYVLLGITFSNRSFSVGIIQALFEFIAFLCISLLLEYAVNEEYLVSVYMLVITIAYIYFSPKNMAIVIAITFLIFIILTKFLHIKLDGDN